MAKQVKSKQRVADHGEVFFVFRAIEHIQPCACFGVDGGQVRFLCFGICSGGQDRIRLPHGGNPVIRIVEQQPGVGQTVLGVGTSIADGIGIGGSSATSGYRLRPSRCGACGHGRPACHDRTGTEGWHHCSQHKKPFTSLCLSSKFDTLNMVLIPEVRGTRHAKRVPRTFFLFNLMTVYRSIS